MTALTIAIDASRTTTTHRTGTENYALKLIHAMLARDAPHRYELYFRDKPAADLFPQHSRVTQHVLRSPRAWTHTRFALALWRSRPDVTFVPAHTLPFWFPGPAVVTVHDVGYKYFPKAHPDMARRYLDLTTRYSVKRATRVIADSLATGHDIAAHYRVPDSKVAVVYPGVDESLAPVTEPAALKALRTRYGLPERYLLFVGTLQPRKNIARIVRAYAQWRAEHPDRGIALVLAGPQGWLYDPQWTAGVDDVILPGYIDDADVAALYTGAEALLFPSLHEGFGFPILEAMRCETPVITSSTSSMPEVAGEAALLVNSRDVGAIAAAIERIVADDELRSALIAKGREQTARFTWQRAAEQTLHVLEQAARP